VPAGGPGGGEITRSGSAAGRYSEFRSWSSQSCRRRRDPSRRQWRKEAGGPGSAGNGTASDIGVRHADFGEPARSSQQAALIPSSVVRIQPWYKRNGTRGIVSRAARALTKRGVGFQRCSSSTSNTSRVPGHASCNCSDIGHSSARRLAPCLHNPVDNHRLAARVIPLRGAPTGHWSRTVSPGPVREGRKRAPSDKCRHTCPRQPCRDLPRMH